MKSYLPIGSIVLLKDSEKRVMVTGFKQKHPDADKIWDYCGCLYPEGVTDGQKMYLFDEDIIEMLYFIGFQDGEGIRYIAGMAGKQ